VKVNNMEEFPQRYGKMSTNEKIALILNAPDEVDEDDCDAIAAREKIAQQRLRRSVLYGSGSRAHLPKVKV